MDFTYSSWAEYPWKNELKLQSERVVLHFGEALSDDFDGPHSPHHMLERAMVLSAISIRRLIERRQITDTLAAKHLSVDAFPMKAAMFRAPFPSQSGGDFHANYDLASPATIDLKLKNIVDEIIHSTQLAVLHPSGQLSGALALASDWGQKKRLLTFTIEEFSNMVELILNDRVAVASDAWDPATGEVSSKRLGKGEMVDGGAGVRLRND